MTFFFKNGQQSADGHVFRRIGQTLLDLEYRGLALFKKDFENLDSTKYAESMDGRANYQIEPEYPEPIKVKT